MRCASSLPLAVNGMTIGYAAMDWADTAVEIPGAAAHPLFPVVASWAVMGAAFGGDLERAATLVARAEAAEAALGSRQPAACQGPGGRWRSSAAISRPRARPRAGVGRRGPGQSDDPYELAHALIMYGAALAVHRRRSKPSTTVEEAVRIARAAGIASVLSIGLTDARGPAPDSTTMPARVALLDEAIDVGTSIGDRMAVSTTSGNKAMFAARLGDWHTALEASVDAAELMLRLGTLQALNGAFWPAAIAFVGLEQLETAAVLIGGGGCTRHRWWSPDWGGGITPAADTAVLAGSR